MSNSKIELNHPIYTAQNEFNIENPTAINLKEEKELVPQSIVTASGATYTEELLLNRIDETALLDDFISGKKITERSERWVECFSRDDLVRIFTAFPKVYDRCQTLMSNTLGPVINNVLLFNDIFCDLFENILQKAKAIHLQCGWAFSEDTDEFTQFELALSSWHTFLKEDAFTAKTSNLIQALDKFAESDFVHLNQIGFSSISTQLYQICQQGRCSAGFTEQLSRVYTAITLARTVLFYGTMHNNNNFEDNEAPREKVKVWDYCQSAVFFKMNPELKKEMEAPLYHGTIDTEAAKRILSNPGDYLARYSPNYKNHYLTVLLDASVLQSKIVLNLIIPPSKVESWIKQPTAHRAEIEFYIKAQLSKEHTENTQQCVNVFLKKEHYDPIFNPVCTIGTANTVLKIR
ncbi:SH2 domain-containing protein [Legionella quateirensis]|uniref:SH2 domain-containing protein n=1 Tax=Legionella quateirensis TaxID=45072 RepID=A0A378KZZ5_9GAMM|nr:SH2 domain-containing protein [Legionella quateirensis]KTD46273.1 hypothetical protein Lqua_2376 [Legionella quateirensis]STY18958.1 Uncharacterised protein [Legionella quateirensis]